MARYSPPSWSFGGPPTATELVIAALAAATVASGLVVAGSLAWGWFLGGVALVVAALGPVKSYMVANGTSVQFGQFYDAIGLAGRTVVVLALAAVLVGVPLVSGVSGASVFYLGQGGLLGVAGVVAMKWIRHREIAG